MSILETGPEEMTVTYTCDECRATWEDSIIYPPNVPNDKEVLTLCLPCRVRRELVEEGYTFLDDVYYGHGS